MDEAPQRLGGAGRPVLLPKREAAADQRHGPQHERPRKVVCDQRHCRKAQQHKHERVVEGLQQLPVPGPLLVRVQRGVAAEALQPPCGFGAWEAVGAAVHGRKHFIDRGLGGLEGIH